MNENNYTQLVTAFAEANAALPFYQGAQLVQP